MFTEAGHLVTSHPAFFYCFFYLWLSLHHFLHVIFFLSLLFLLFLIFSSYSPSSYIPRRSFPIHRLYIFPFCLYWIRNSCMNFATYRAYESNISIPVVLCFHCQTSKWRLTWSSYTRFFCITETWVDGRINPLKGLSLKSLEKKWLHKAFTYPT